MRELKENKAITLIALVVTIVVLLILAGVSLNLVIGNNGIITKAQDAKLMSRAGSAEDEVNLWKNDTYIGQTAGLETTSKNAMLQVLKDKKLIYEEEIDRENEIITIKKKDGTIVKEISYGNVVINISKTPETEKAGAVLLKVTSVEGILSAGSEEGWLQLIETLDEITKKELFKTTTIIYFNVYYDANVSSFEEVLEYAYEQEWISSSSEEEFWKNIGEEEISEELIWNIEDIYDAGEGNLISTITNPAGEKSDSYIATENGTYTFTITDILTGKEYQKSVEVTNIDSSIGYYVGNVDNEYGDNAIGLKDKTTNERTTFEKAYIIYKDKRIEITDIIWEAEDNEDYDYIWGNQLCRYLNNTVGIEEEAWDVIAETEQTFILVKDEVEYIGTAIVYTYDE